VLSDSIKFYPPPNLSPKVCELRAALCSPRSQPSKIAFPPLIANTQILIEDTQAENTFRV